MAQKVIKYYGSKYKYVKYIECNSHSYWALNYPRVTKKSYPTERDAAIAIDKILISKGKKPVNILVHK